MEKKTLLAIVLSIIVIVVFSYFAPQRPVQRPIEPQQVDKQAKMEKEELPALVEMPTVPVEVPVEEKEIHVETDLYSAVFTTRGGTLKRWDLKEYRYKDKNEKDNPVPLVSPDATIPPLSIILDGKLKDLPTKVNYSADKDIIRFDSYSKRDTLTFSYTDPAGLSIKKVFTFYKDSYRVDLSTEVKGVPSYKVAIGSGFGIFDEKGTWVHIGPVLLKESSKIDIDKNNIEGIGFLSRWFAGRKSKNEVTHKGNIWWIAQEDKYFTSALASVSRNNDAVVWKWKDEGNSKAQDVEIAYEVAGEKGEFLLYAGPKNYDILKTFGVGLEHIIDFGFFSIIARPLFWILKLFYKFIGNYGWAIILLTIVVRIPFIPLINKGQKSMKKLQDVQPQMAAIREKYKKDPQRMQKEIMELYRKHKVNPMGGCWPMLIQIPVFFALYKILLIAIELRGAPFIWWIKDLSAPDTLFGHIPSGIPIIGGVPVGLFPILMGISMVIQQKMTPTSMDPKQAKIMMFMPIFFTFLFLSFPSGLVIYWLISNILGIIQQLYVNKKAKA